MSRGIGSGVGEVTQSSLLLYQVALHYDTRYSLTLCIVILTDSYETTMNDYVSI